MPSIVRELVGLVAGLDTRRDDVVLLELRALGTWRVTMDRAQLDRATLLAPEASSWVRARIALNPSALPDAEWTVVAFEWLPPDIEWLEYYRDVLATEPLPPLYHMVEGIVDAVHRAWITVQSTNGFRVLLPTAGLRPRPVHGQHGRFRCIARPCEPREYRIIGWEEMRSDIQPIGVAVDTLMVLEDLQEDLRELEQTGKYSAKVGKGLQELRKRLEDLVTQETLLKRRRQSPPAEPERGRSCRPRRARPEPAAERTVPDPLPLAMPDQPNATSAELAAWRSTLVEASNAAAVEPWIVETPVWQPPIIVYGTDTGRISETR